MTVKKATLYKKLHFFIKRLNDTRSENCFLQFSKKMAGRLLLTFLICLHN